MTVPLSRQAKLQQQNLASGWCRNHKGVPAAEGHTVCPACLERVNRATRDAYRQQRGGSVRETRCTICDDTDHNSRSCPERQHLTEAEIKARIAETRRQRNLARNRRWRQQQQESS